MRAIKNWSKRRLRDVFEIGQRIGVDILPKHFYSSIPDVHALRADSHWRQALEMHGVAGTGLPEQVTFLEDLCPPSSSNQWKTLDVHQAADNENGQSGGYGIIEAEVLNAFIRRHQPKRIVQVGCGLSTSVIIKSASMADYKPDIVCIEPYPSAFLLSAEENGQITLIKEQAEKVSRETMTGLQAGDMLFVDSTHTVKPGSEVNRIILDILPHLQPGVFIHFHDIYFPYDYSRDLLSQDLFFHCESTLLHAYLVHNSRCKIVLSLSMLHYGAQAQIAALFPYYNPQENIDGLRVPGATAKQHFPSATYLLTTAPGANE